MRRWRDRAAVNNIIIIYTCVLEKYRTQFVFIQFSRILLCLFFSLSNVCTHCINCATECRMMNVRTSHWLLHISNIMLCKISANISVSDCLLCVVIGTSWYIVLGISRIIKFHIKIVILETGESGYYERLNHMNKNLWCKYY